MAKGHSGKAPAVRFRATVLQSGKTATGVQVPESVVSSLGPSKKPAVHVTINGHTYRSSVASMGGRFMLGISAEQRQNTGVKAGDEIDVALELDTAPREVNVPADFAAALARDSKAKKFFDSLSYSNRLRHVLSIEGAKTDETRQRRIEKSVTMMHEGKV